MRAELVDRLAAAGVPRIEAVSFVNPGRVPQMAGAEEVVAGARAARRASSTPGSSSTSAATSGSRPRRSTRCTSRSPSRDEFNRRNAGASVEESVAAGERIVERAHADGIRVDRDDRRRVRLPVRGRRRPGPRARAGRRASRRPARTRSSSPTRSASACRGRCVELVGEAREARRPGRRPPPQHAQHGLRERAGRARGGRDRARRVGRRHRRLPVRAARDGEHRHRGPRLPAPRRGHRDGHRPRCADRRSPHGSRGALGRRARGSGLQSRHVRAGRG